MAKMHFPLYAALDALWRLKEQIAVYLDISLLRFQSTPISEQIAGYSVQLPL